MNTKLPAINLHSTLPKVALQTEVAQLEMSSPKPEIHIDQTQCFADAGLRTPAAFTDYNVSLARSATLEAIGQIASEGDALADCKHSTVASVVAGKWGDTRDTNVKAIPQQMPEISFDTEPVQVYYQPGSVNLELQQGNVDSQLDWGKVDTYMLQKNFVQFNYIGKVVSAVA